MDEEYEFDELIAPDEVIAPVIEPLNEEIEDMIAVINHAKEDMAEMGPLGRFVEAETVAPELETSWWDKATDVLFDRFIPEVGEMLEQKWHEGANEVAKALYGHADGFVLYGHQTLEPTEMPSFEDMLGEAAQRGGQELEREMER